MRRRVDKPELRRQAGERFFVLCGAAVFVMAWRRSFSLRIGRYVTLIGAATAPSSRQPRRVGDSSKPSLHFATEAFRSAQRGGLSASPT